MCANSSVCERPSRRNAARRSFSRVRSRWSSRHPVTVSELDEMWRRQLFAVVSDHHGSHIFPHPSVEGQHAINVVVRLCLIDFDRKGQFLIGVTGLSPGRFELRSREITVGQSFVKRFVAVALVLRPRPVPSCLRQRRVWRLEPDNQHLTVGVVLVFDGLTAGWVRRPQRTARRRYRTLDSPAFRNTWLDTPRDGRRSW